ncbi:hypothetical protein PUS82_00480 [Cytobacillus firmus]|uniref:hypothetical protein n=1 Tax=Cytobacillus firmus TaxID=1399 RepID=UPI00237A92EE|nr:hypothetical protein [Cytobacillus firmus]MDD9309807.1 hypothetical protein [Cytobacillus firmus]
MTVEEIAPMLMDTIVEEIYEDDECVEKKGERLLERFLEATQPEQALINDLFIDLTGYSFESLIELTQNR